MAKMYQDESYFEQVSEAIESSPQEPEKISLDRCIGALKMLLLLRTENLSAFDAFKKVGQVPHWVTDFKEIVA
jgi:hypothetical protein